MQTLSYGGCIAIRPVIGPSHHLTKLPSWLGSHRPRVRGLPSSFRSGGILQRGVRSLGRRFRRRGSERWRGGESATGSDLSDLNQNKVLTSSSNRIWNKSDVSRNHVWVVVEAVSSYSTTRFSGVDQSLAALYRDCIRLLISQLGSRWGGG